MLDVLIQGARVYDGTGGPWFLADVGVRGGRIVALGRVREAARRRIGAAGMAVCPGFIDVHAHADDIIARPSADNVLRQGVTTIISGNCGSSGWPIRRLLADVEAAGPAVNFATLAGHGTIRERVMGLAARRPTAKELSRMCRLVERSMREGAVGISTGLVYVPGAYAFLPELVEVSRAAAAWGGVYASHARSASRKALEAIREAGAIGRRAKIGVEFSHIKVAGRRGRGQRLQAADLLAEVRRQREAGVDMTFDVYPYDASSTSLSAVVVSPRLARDGRLAQRLGDPAVRRRERAKVAASLAWSGGAERVTVVAFEPDRSLEGMTLAAIARARGADPAETAMGLIVEADPTCVYHSMLSEDVDEFVRAPEGMIGTDGMVVPVWRKVVHPRNYGTFPRVLSDYVRGRGLLTLEEAIRKMTGFPARKFGLTGRGLIAAGMIADLVVFDPRRIADRSTYDKPHAYPAGIKAVLVDGQIAWDGRRLSSRRHGEVIRGG